MAGSHIAITPYHTITGYCGCRRWTLSHFLWLRPPIHFILIGDLLNNIYIYIVFQHLVPWLVVIRMQIQPYICYWYWERWVDVVGADAEAEGGLSVSSYNLDPPIPFILIAGLLYTYIMQFSTCYCGYRSYGCLHTLIFNLCDLRVESGSAWCRRWVSVSSYDWGPPPTSQSYQVFFIYI